MMSVDLFYRCYAVAGCYAATSRTLAIFRSTNKPAHRRHIYVKTKLIDFGENNGVVHTHSCSNKLFVEKSDACYLQLQKKYVRVIHAYHTARVIL